MQNAPRNNDEEPERCEPVKISANDAENNHAKCRGKHKKKKQTRHAQKKEKLYYEQKSTLQKESASTKRWNRLIKKAMFQKNLLQKNTKLEMQDVICGEKNRPSSSTTNEGLEAKVNPDESRIGNQKSEHQTNVTQRCVQEIWFGRFDICED